jgi:hypothetical protein
MPGLVRQLHVFTKLSIRRSGRAPADVECGKFEEELRMIYTASGRALTTPSLANQRPRRRRRQTTARTLWSSRRYTLLHPGDP